MPIPCSVCFHPMASKIDSDLLAGLSLHSVRAKYTGVTVPSLSRHRNRHLGAGHGLTDGGIRSAQRAAAVAPAIDGMTPQLAEAVTGSQPLAIAPSTESLRPESVTREFIIERHGRVLARLETLVIRLEANGADRLMLDALRAIREQVAELARVAGVVPREEPAAPNFSVVINLGDSPNERLVINAAATESMLMDS